MTYGVNAKENIKNGIPEDFNWIEYRSLNKDLSSIKSYPDAVKHYIHHGRRQNRKYKCDENLEDIFKETRLKHINIENKMPDDFDWIIYKESNPDIKDQITDYFTAVKHYHEHGHRENRKYSNKTDIQQQTQVQIQTQPANNLYREKIPIDFNWIAYKTLNVGLENIKNETQAKHHYSEHGFKESRIYTFPVDVKNPINEIYQRKLDDINEKLRLLEEDKKFLEKEKKHIENDYTNWKNRIINSEESVPLQISKPELKKVETTVAVEEIKVEAKVEAKVEVEVEEETKVEANVEEEANVVFIRNELTEANNYIIHFIFGLDKDNVFYKFMYFAILSAFKIHKPKEIMFHYQYLPVGEWFDKIRPYIKLCKIDVTYPHPNIKHFSHKTDYIKLIILQKFGGLYLDIDTLSTKMFIPDNKIILLKHGSEYGIQSSFLYLEDNYPNEFITKWIQSYSNFKVDKWNYNSTVIPKILSKDLKYISIISNEWYPLWFESTKLYTSLKEFTNFANNAFFIHLWESNFINLLLSDNSILNYYFEIIEH